MAVTYSTRKTENNLAGTAQFCIHSLICIYFISLNRNCKDASQFFKNRETKSLQTTDNSIPKMLLKSDLGVRANSLCEVEFPHWVLNVLSAPLMSHHKHLFFLGTLYNWHIPLVTVIFLLPPCSSLSWCWQWGRTGFATSSGSSALLLASLLPASFVHRVLGISGVSNIIKLLNSSKV